MQRLDLNIKPTLTPVTKSKHSGPFKIAKKNIFITNIKKNTLIFMPMVCFGDTATDQTPQLHCMTIKQRLWKFLVSAVSQYGLF